MAPVLKNLGNPEDAVWMFRILNQINQLSQAAGLGTAEHAEFESAHVQLFELMRQCANARHELRHLVQQHIEYVSEGRSVLATDDGHIHVEDDLEPQLNRVLNSFFVGSRTVFYHLFGQPAGGKARKRSSQRLRARSLTEILTQENLSFVQVHKDAEFEKAAKRYSVTSRAAAHLMDVIRADRNNWMLGLIDIRNRIIHDTSYQSVKMIYKANGKKVLIGFPRLNDIPMIDFVEMFWNNLVDAVEEITLASIATRNSCIAFVPIPEKDWDPNLPFRWRGVLLNASTPV